MCVHHSAFTCFDAGFRVAVVRDACGDRSLKRHDDAISLLEEFSSCFMRKLWCLEMSILLRFWRVLGALVFGMSVFLCMSIWNGFGISSLMELG